ncbi:hypothetical protein ASPZODRAFT_126769 [Penicilliopsis zonata CBS 506.65]|uniref:G-patch domain-containing protein n=1 Tax=Penicilliopsis zonata CBS 506.65 TaxID=1073090 RepID=A0A1L9SUD6_9EURO|nr:hypothetical protein ASPZODRAFT_126769 [Penicilliopsis zonata CBS 506.65]OJJ50822.1 hypothetical protein ASPZODRAFT_126769 [Penicilliopsis zonata CBS 506.65]
MTDEDYFLPLEDQRVFGAGISRKRVQFVPSSEHLTTTSSSIQPATTATEIANKYLSIVLPEKPSAEGEKETVSVLSSPVRRCEVCRLPLADEGEEEDDDQGTKRTTSTTKPHESSLAHQVCLEHSHPPSHLDRTRHGLRYLSAYGWDPDSRLGLGAPGREGIRDPLKPQVKNDTVGLGIKRHADGEKEKAKPAAKVQKTQKLNAKQARMGYARAQKKSDRLREMFFQNDDVQRYLGE